MHKTKMLRTKLSKCTQKDLQRVHNICCNRALVTQLLKKLQLEI